MTSVKHRCVEKLIIDTNTMNTYHVKFVKQSSDIVNIFNGFTWHYCYSSICLKFDEYIYMYT